MPRRSHPRVPGQAKVRRLVGARIRQLRTERELTQAELGGRYFDRGYVSAVEVGRIAASLGALLQFSRKLEVPIGDLFRDD